jgi:hypothetical protein
MDKKAFVPLVGRHICSTEYADCNKGFYYALHFKDGAFVVGFEYGEWDSPGELVFNPSLSDRLKLDLKIIDQAEFDRRKKIVEIDNAEKKIRLRKRALEVAEAKVKKLRSELDKGEF